MRVFFFLVLSIVIVSCNTSTSTFKTVNSQTSLASLISLDYGSTDVILTDYIEVLSDSFSIIAPNGLSIDHKKGAAKIKITSNQNAKPISIIKVITKSDTIAIGVKKSTKQKHIVSFSDPKHQYKKVGIKGEFNAWNPANTPLVFSNGKWTGTIYLEPDNYAYQYVVDGEETLDPSNPEKISNGMGGWNSKLSIGNKKSLKPNLSDQAIKGNTIIIKKNNETKYITALWNNTELPTHINANEIEITIPARANEVNRSSIRCWASNDENVSEEMYIPLKQGKVITKANQLNRHDKETNIMYYAMIDRFHDADSTNNAPLNDPEVDAKADFHGGDLEGIKEKIENGYFKELGISALWLSPIVQNPEGKFGFFNKKEVQSKFSSFHGYWPISFTKIDYRFGTEQDLKDIVTAAHKNDMNVYLDFVANHVHEQHPTYQAHKDWATNLHLPDGSLNTERWDDHRLTTWFDVFLPTLNLEKPEVAEMLSDSAMFWIDKYDIDGFRHDATKHIPLNFWRTLTSKTKEYTRKTNKPIYQVGETYGTPSLINSYINSGMLDGQFDFNVYDALLESICNDASSFELFESRINQSFKYYGTHNLMGYMTGNQDKPRFMAMATGDVLSSEDTKYAGWSRLINRKTKIGYDKLGIMHAFLFTIPGVPVVYYGDEIGLTGGNDPDNRRDMRFNQLTSLENELKTKVSTLAKMRRAHPVFMFGDMRFEKVENDHIIYSRNYFGQSALVLINNSDKTLEYNLKTVEPKKVIFGSELKNGDISIAPYSFEVLISDK